MRPWWKDLKPTGDKRLDCRPTKDYLRLLELVREGVLEDDLVKCGWCKRLDRTDYPKRQADTPVSRRAFRCRFLRSYERHWVAIRCYAFMAVRDGPMALRIRLGQACRGLWLTPQALYETLRAGGDLPITLSDRALRLVAKAHAGRLNLDQAERNE